MSSRKAVASIVLTVVALTGLPALAAQQAKTTKKDKATSAIPRHPDELKFAPLAFEVPDAAKYSHRLSNGIPVYIAEDHDLPLVDLSITLRAGAFLDPPDKPGLASATGAMLRRGGAGQLTAEEFDERVDFLAANIGSFTGDTSGGASLDCITGVLDETLDLFFQMLKTPRFQQDRWEVERENLLEQMKQRNDSPQSISSREWQWLLRGREHFSSRLMTESQLRALKRDDLVAFHRRYWRPENMIIAVSGDVTPAEILKKLEGHFAQWKVEGPPVPWPPPPPSHTPQPGLYYVEKEIPQGRVLIGHLGTQRRDWNDPEPFALTIMNDILGGGGFTSRLMKRIRSDEGLAYGAGSSFGVGEYWPGVFSIGFQSKNPTVAYATKIALEEIKRIREQPVSDEELRVAKGSFIDVFPRRFESAAQIAGTFADDEYEGRPHDYWASYRDRLRAVTVEDVQAVAKKHLHPDRLVYLIVGNWAEIAPGDADGRAAMAEFGGGRATRIPLRDPLTLEPIEGK